MRAATQPGPSERHRPRDHEHLEHRRPERVRSLAHRGRLHKGPGTRPPINSPTTRTRKKCRQWKRRLHARSPMRLLLRHRPTRTTPPGGVRTPSEVLGPRGTARDMRTRDRSPNPARQLASHPAATDPRARRLETPFTPDGPAPTPSQSPARPTSPGRPTVIPPRARCSSHRDTGARFHI
jgi:hypothetical protein